ncbi:hypothetical protein [Candidatus Allofournierella merdavium]|uniref:hypothetical protein n=1 Tax=Candidatus Allofournierella merdavium TaxID=2838593 RepID=UPI00374F0B0E
MADQKKDPYQYERMLRQRAQQAFSNQFPGFGTKPPEPDQPNQGRPGGAPSPADPTQELVQSIHEMGKVIAKEVGSALGKATREVGGALSDAAREVRKNTAQSAARPRPAPQPARRAGDALASRVNQAGSNLASGLRDGLCIFGGTLAVCCALFTGLSALGTVISLVIFWDAISFVGMLFLLALTAAFGFTARWAFGQPARRARLRRYLAAMGADRSVPLQRLAEAVRRPVSFVKKDLDRMIRQNWLPDSFVDDEEGVFFIHAADYRALQRRQEAAARAEAAPAGTNELAELLQQCSDFDLLLGEHIQNMTDQPELRDSLLHMRVTAADIQNWVKAHPASAGKVRKFARYYMPTTLKLLRTYADVKDQQGQAAGNIRQEIGGILATLNTAFDNLRNDLLTDTALDISSEISAMQTMLAQDGLAEYKSPR